MNYPSLSAVIKCLVNRLRYMNRREAYYEATAKNLEMAATAVVEASDETMRRLKRQSVRTQAQRKRIARASDTLTKLLERTKYSHDGPQHEDENE